ncbi:hypothetical protein IP92_05818 [Pseudoduganella flava]|uniref:Uncharacterized protein n=1 Tax=Pseudoduganella flava TaxID=871742 RepID=A0A562P994_9BURK|nr:hypothetical protein [Pseudoduganella flava]QGZ38060.1 hypothetical protein GO485_02680 [Pseudoduganella flava]TWI40998.1 hypothetical protein IP92_05818 [Pseudoduganella flava]
MTTLTANAATLGNTESTLTRVLRVIRKELRRAFELSGAPYVEALPPL